MAAAYELIDVARREPGCLYYDLHASLTDPDRVMCLEHWRSRAALETHFGTPHLSAFATAIAGLVVSRKIEIIHPDHVETL